MIKIENVDVFGWEAAIRGARNPMNSWGKSDSEYKVKCDSLSPGEEAHYCTDCGYDMCSPYLSDPEYVIGPNDLDLLQRLSKAGPDHGKYLRMIHVQMDVIAPLYWWKEFSTYKVGTTANSCSTMHKIHAKPFTMDDFSTDHLYENSKRQMEELIEMLNHYRENYNRWKTKDDWWQLIQLLPSSYNQLRTLDLNYAVLKNMYHARKNHKLDEWRSFCEWIEMLPYAGKLICVEDIA